MPGHPDWAGISQLSQAEVAAEAFAATVAGGATSTITGTIIRQGYEIYLAIETSAVVSSPVPVLIEMSWQESTLSIPTGYQRWWVLAGQNGTPHVINGSGPSNGNQVTIKITNALGAAGSILYSLGLQDVARPYLTHAWRTRDDLGSSFPNYTAASSDLAANIVGSASGVSVPGGSSVVAALPLIAGQAQLQAIGIAGSGCDVFIKNAADNNLAAGPTGLTFAQASAAVNVPVYLTLVLPRAQCLLVLTNPGTVAQNVFWALTAL